MIRVPLLIGLVLLGACTRASAPITIAQALNEVQRQLAQAGTVSAVGTDPARFATVVRQAQCASGQADPEVPLLAHELDITLTGSFTAGGGFTVGPSPLSASISGNGARTQGQEITLPLSFVALSEVPAASAAQRLAAIAALPQAEQRTETAAILADRDALRARIGALIAGYDPAACNGHQRSPGPFTPNTRM
ncbi:hypothetical protein NFI95_08680 [Acetobacteraceae bacterium KSS8]|uniref:Lipoprotein n=1 Tax=Endosaccharibacter trunci TaxID=2812733 RepID=A0ABT1W6M6_9PROT|nr:hypothetical protein [Acetobacteraceae bacterium KSS8]